MNVYVVLEHRVGHTNELLIGVCKSHEKALDVARDRAAVWGEPMSWGNSGNMFVSGDRLLRIREEWLQ